MGGYGFRLHDIQHCFWMPGRYLEQHTGRAFRNTPALFPIAQRAHTDPHQCGKLFLGQAKAIPAIPSLEVSLVGNPR